MKERIDFVNETVELWYQLIKTQAILQRIIEKSLPEKPLLTAQDIKDSEQRALRTVQARFPHLGIVRV